MHSSLDALDLNLLRVFEAIMREGSITAAGALMGQTQSSMSHALARLRQHLGDPLFVRTTRGMQATPYAERFSISVNQAFDALRAGVETGAAFDPKTSTRSFTLLTTDMAELLLFPALIARLNTVAPNIGIVSAQTLRSEYRNELEKSAADLAIGKLPESHVDFHQQHLFDVAVGCLVRIDHPTIGKRMTLSQFMEAPQIVISEPAQVDALVRRALGKRASQRRIALRLTHYLAVPSILKASNLIAVIPAMGNALTLAAQNLRYVELPFPIPPLRIMQFWHERDHRDEGHRWLRRTIAEQFMGRMGELNMDSAATPG